MPFPFFAALAAATPFISQGLNFLGNKKGAETQQANNMQLAAFQHEKNMELLKYQLDYNSPSAQMGRFKEAGLNPNLIYGQGSPGNMESAPRYPEIQPANYAAAYTDLGTKIQQSRLLQAQADLTNVKVEESTVKQDLMNAQRNLIKANPYMNEGYVQALVTNLKASADIKAQQADFLLSKTQDEATGVRWERGFLKMQRELDLLGQRFNLGSADQKVKAEILQSKEFQNALQQIQLNWMREGDITPQHIYTGIMLLLSKMM